MDYRNRIADYLQQWSLQADGLPVHTHGACLLPVLRGGQPAMLKLSAGGDEGRAGAVLRWWDGEGAVRVLAASPDDDVLLLERAPGSRALDALAHAGEAGDAAATGILCAVAARLHAPRPVAPALPALSGCFAALATAAAHGGVFSACHAVAQDLLAAPQDSVVLHGDLHHGNVLDGGARGWLAIDPKGYVGERGFDFANILCNPDAALATAPGRLQRQVSVIAGEARLDPARLVAWVAAWAGLSAAWHLEDGTPPQTALAVAAIALGALRA
ncbi:aminoglycoside phosphotransferase family protein [Janthinobacterium sp. 1_2014MBL_MicDiv]|uniref:aminoglycoside phosphotransferase family protein n=1 Tax=Janthinobacterium sp. 1_2014MBL_MicDiv TaxID=1644131 RepID=UPI0008F52543|nr:aminoglycoside phosphotransferase family protein [Janthinobacterium sp. 1_2014MBL_MicDiv]APA68261.1 3'-kinase [Janthinobacterium sp. 1_2014MBL_MicDiv]